MSKASVVATATALGVAINDTMTEQEILDAIVANSKPVVVAPATVVTLATAPAYAPESGKSVVTSFRYMGKWAHVTLKNGVSGIVGSAEQYPFRDLLSLKGSGMECGYVRGENRTTPKGTYKQYSLDWSVE